MTSFLVVHQETGKGQIDIPASIDKANKLLDLNEHLNFGRLHLLYASHRTFVLTKKFPAYPALNFSSSFFMHRFLAHHWYLSHQLYFSTITNWSAISCLPHYLRQQGK